MSDINYPIRIKVNGYAASELDIAHEAVESSDWNVRMVSQWTGTHIVIFDADHARVISDIACEWSNEIDRSIDSGLWDDCAQTKRHMRAARDGMTGVYRRINQMTEG